MKKLILKILLFFILAIAVLTSFSELMKYFPSRLFVDKNWISVHKRIIRSKQKIEGKTLYLGDSVADQLFDFEKNENSLTCNAAILMAGHYILAYNAIQNNPQLEKIVLISVPQELGTDFYWRPVYSNFTIPFFRFSNLEHFDRVIYKKFDEFKFSYITLPSFMKILPFSDVDYSRGKKREDRDILSEITIHYLKKLRGLCFQHNIELQIVSPPVSKIWKSRTFAYKKMKRQILNEGLEDVFNNYFENIIYLSSNRFRDGLHLKKIYLQDFIINFYKNHALEEDDLIPRNSG